MVVSCNGNNPTKIDDLGGTPILGNLRIWQVPIFRLLPRLKTAYSELPPMAARWKRAQRAMTIIAEMDEKITTCRTKELELIG